MNSWKKLVFGMFMILMVAPLSFSATMLTSKDYTGFADYTVKDTFMDYTYLEKQKILNYKYTR